ncbi:hypothetical protein NONI108955_44820 [Nocardia ninae]
MHPRITPVSGEFAAVPGGSMIRVPCVGNGCGIREGLAWGAAWDGQDAAPGRVISPAQGAYLRRGVIQDCLYTKPYRHASPAPHCPPLAIAPLILLFLRALPVFVFPLFIRIPPFPLSSIRLPSRGLDRTMVCAFHFILALSSFGDSGEISGIPRFWDCGLVGSRASVVPFPEFDGKSQKSHWRPRHTYVTIPRGGAFIGSEIQEMKWRRRLPRHPCPLDVCKMVNCGAWWPLN